MSTDSPVASKFRDSSDWLDSDGKFLFGKEGIKGRSYQVVCEENPGYLRWILTKDVSEEDYDLIRNCLVIAGELNDY